MKPQRLESLDFIKGVLILLMIAFHLVYIGDSYPYLKKVVYTFHMPAFLILSGYLMNIEKSATQFGRSMHRFLLPYLLLESGYILMAAVLPIREHIDLLTPNVYLHHLLVAPLGPYWYLHTLMLCGIAYYVVFRLRMLQLMTRILLLALCLFTLTLPEHFVAAPYALYFFIGVAIRHLSAGFTSVFRPTILALPCLILLALYPSNLSTDAVGSLLIIYCAISSCLFVYRNNKVGRFVAYLGRHSLTLYLYSPIFTFACKPLVPFLSFDPSGIVFLILSLGICTVGSLLTHQLILYAVHILRTFTKHIGKRTH